MKKYRALFPLNVFVIGYTESGNYLVVMNQENQTNFIVQEVQKELFDSLYQEETTETTETTENNN